MNGQKRQLKRSHDAFVTNTAVLSQKTNPLSASYRLLKHSLSWRRQSHSMLFIEATTHCPNCGSEAVRRVRRKGLEKLCLEKVFECGGCEARFARANYGMPKALLAILVRLKLLR